MYKQVLVHILDIKDQFFINKMNIKDMLPVCKCGQD